MTFENRTWKLEPPKFKGNKALGAYGEEQVAEELQRQGFEIEARNYRSAYGELDLVARKGDCTSFIEVKTRRGLYFGHPFESVGRKKLERMKATIHEYRQGRLVRNAQIVIAAVLLMDGSLSIEFEIFKG